MITISSDEVDHAAPVSSARSRKSPPTIISSDEEDIVVKTEPASPPSVCIKQEPVSPPQSKQKTWSRDFYFCDVAPVFQASLDPKSKFLDVKALVTKMFKGINFQDSTFYDHCQQYQDASDALQI